MNEDSNTTHLNAAHTADSASGAGAPQIPGYEFMQGIAMGGQGFVFRAMQKSTRRVVAVKVLHEDGGPREDARRRFDREIALVARLNHPNIVAIYDSGNTSDGRRYCVMDYVSGKPLDAYVRDNRPSLPQILRLFLGVCEAVEYAHRRGVVHRDLKPSNILVDGHGRPHVLDFGLAKWLAAPADSVLSRGTALLGTLPYMAPEQARTDVGEVDSRTDVYALGVILYRLLVGDYPYPVTGRVVDIIRNIHETPPASPRRRWSPETGVARGRNGFRHGCPIDADIETILLKMLAKEPGRRYQSVSDLVRDINHFLHSEPIEARRDSLVYIVKTRIRSQMRRSQLVASVTMALLVLLAATFIFDPHLANHTSINEEYRRLVRHLFAHAAAADFSDIAMIALTDEASLIDLAALAGAPPDCYQKDSYCIRRFHGALMRKLAEAGPAVVTWPSTFVPDTEHDDALLEGILALREAGTEVVVTAPRWERRPDGAPLIADKIAPHVRWGCGLQPLKKTWPIIAVALYREPGEVYPSLAAAAYGAFRQPNRLLELQVDTRTDELKLLYWTEAPRTPRERRIWDEHDAKRMSYVEVVPEDIPERGMRRNDVVGYLFVDIGEAREQALRTVTTSYQDVFELPVETLRERFAGRIVIVGDARTAIREQIQFEAFNNMWYADVHAIAIGTLLADRPLVLMDRTGTIWLNALAAAAGVGLGWTMAGRRIAQLAAVTATLLVLAAACAAAIWYARVLIVPVVPAITVILGFALGAMVRHSQLPEREELFSSVTEA